MVPRVDVEGDNKRETSPKAILSIQATAEPEGYRDQKEEDGMGSYIDDPLRQLKSLTFETLEEAR